MFATVLALAVAAVCLRTSAVAVAMADAPLSTLSTPPALVRPGYNILENLQGDIRGVPGGTSRGSPLGDLLDNTRANDRAAAAEYLLNTRGPPTGNLYGDSDVHGGRQGFHGDFHFHDHHGSLKDKGVRDRVFTRDVNDDLHIGAPYTVFTTQPEGPRLTEAVETSTEKQKEEKNVSCPPLEILDFLHFNHSNLTQVAQLELEWPCEVRLYLREIYGLVVLVKFLFEYGTIALIITGLIVNVYAIFVLNSPPINKCNISIYLKALAVSDIGALIFNVSVSVIRARCTAVNDFYIHYRWTCILHKVLFTVFFYYSTSLVITFTFERLLMIRNPFKIHTWHNEKPAKITVIILAVVTLGIALLRSMTSGFEQDNMYGYTSCRAKVSPVISIDMIPFMVLSTILPTILISIANVCLLIHVRRSAQDHCNLNALNPEEHRNAVKVTRMLIIISIVYLVLYMPLGIMSITELYYRNHVKVIPTESGPELDAYIKWKKQMLLFRWIRGLFFFMYLLNYINNFFLYCLSGDIFRQTVKACLRHNFPSFFHKFCPCLKNEEASSNLTQRNSRSPNKRERTGQLQMSERKTSQSNLYVENFYNNTAFLDTEESSSSSSNPPTSSSNKNKH